MLGLRGGQGGTGVWSDFALGLQAKVRVSGAEAKCPGRAVGYQANRGDQRPSWPGAQSWCRQRSRGLAVRRAEPGVDPDIGKMWAGRLTSQGPLLGFSSETSHLGGWIG